ncbi:hypothetical protein E1757_30965 [Paenibacillus piri]|uniref:Arabinan endo-1,5-alpha-L-arabinosidase n=1 Tax=Paenibacillus piri TaxID=2547395 RepID=A0A4R5KBT2_9BACL|nr:hypothetical protein E1757_30965 [Paenibacillus piri]
MNPAICDNINGPSLIKVPDWIENPLGAYYLYFAHHETGQNIRLAYADSLTGPWTLYEPGTLQIGQTKCVRHVASPDVHVDHDKKQIRMYYHGPVAGEQFQQTFVATSSDGIRFETNDVELGTSYFRVFYWDGYYYGIVMPGLIVRSKDGLSNFEKGPLLFTEHMRHSAVYLNGSTLLVFYSNVKDVPEHIVVSRINLADDWLEWKPTEPVSVIQPELDYEGADLPLEPSVRGWSEPPVRQLRDPAIYKENGAAYLLYSVAGEQGIAIAEIDIDAFL